MWAQLASYIMFPAHHGVCQVFKDYHFGEVVGKGSFGKVQLVTHKKTGAKRACKTIGKTGCPSFFLDSHSTGYAQRLRAGYSDYCIIDLRSTPPFPRTFQY